MGQPWHGACLRRSVSQPHEKLIAWQRADDLCLAVYRLARELPSDERYALAFQLRRAAYSVPANIVEGFAYRAAKMRIKHLRIAIASLAEVAYGVHFAHRAGYVPAGQKETLDEQIRRVAAPLHGLLARFAREAQSQKPV